MEQEKPQKPNEPGEPRSLVLIPFFAMWVLYGVALVARVVSDPNNPTWGAVQRYAFVVALGLLARYKRNGWLTWIPIALAIMVLGAVVIEGSDPTLAAKLGGAFVVAVGVGQLLRRN